MAGLCLSVHNRTMSDVRRTNKWRRFTKLDGADRWLLLRAAAWILIARIMLVVIPFNRLAARLSAQRGSINTEPDPDVLQRIGFAVRVAANNVPWRSDCFLQTIAARVLLKRFGYASTIHFGIDRVGEDGLEGHAWLTCGETVVTGGGEMDRYTEVHSLL